MSRARKQFDSKTRRNTIAARLVGVAIAMLIGTVATLTLSGVAEADGGHMPPGPSGHLSLYDDRHFDDRRIPTQTSISDLGASAYKFNDKTTSVVNKTGRYWLLYDDKGYEDRAWCIKPHSHVHNLGNQGFNDKTSSVWRGGTSSSSCGGRTPIGSPNG